MTNILKNMRKWIAIKKQKEKAVDKGKIRKLKKKKKLLKIKNTTVKTKDSIKSWKLQRINSSYLNNKNKKKHKMSKKKS